MSMTEKQYVERACATLGIDLIKPTRKAPGIILGYKSSNGFNNNVIDASNWSQAKEQLDAWRINKAIS